MMQPSTQLSRRQFVAGVMAAAAAVKVSDARLLAAESVPGVNRICAFTKYLQSMSYEELAERIAKLGFHGVEATVRDGGQVLPERVDEDLPKLVESLKQHNLEITVMTSSIGGVDEPHTEKVLRTASSLGVKLYRLKNYRYDLAQPVLRQLDELRPVLKDLAALNRELGIRAVYQNHSGANYVGAAVWDLHSLIKDYPPQELGAAFDICHATVEGGLAWPIHYNLLRPHMAAVYVKDFAWQGRKPKTMPLGEGMVDSKFISMLASSDYRGPISVHVEYLEQAGVEENLAALGRDLGVLKSWLAAAAAG